MKKLLTILVFSTLLFSCSKEIETINTREDCKLPAFAPMQRQKLDDAAYRRPNLPPGQVNRLQKLIYLDFDGHYVADGFWGNWYASPSGLTTQEQLEIFTKVQSWYQDSMIMGITIDSVEYKKAHPYKRSRVVITETNPFGQIGGIAYVGSATWGGDIPCFVFSNLLEFNTHYIAGAAAHEGGHTMSLRHQTEGFWTTDGWAVSNAYKPGPIMGLPYYEPNPYWDYGMNSVGQVQHDTKQANHYIQ